MIGLGMSVTQVAVRTRPAPVGTVKAAMAQRTMPDAMYGTSSMAGGADINDPLVNMLGEAIDPKYFSMTVMKWCAINSYGTAGSLNEWRDDRNSGPGGTGAGGDTRTIPSALCVFEQGDGPGPDGLMIADGQSNPANLTGRRLHLQMFTGNTESSYAGVANRMKTAIDAVPLATPIAIYSGYSTRGSGGEPYVVQSELRAQKYILSGARRNAQTYFVPWDTYLWEWNGPEKVFARTSPSMADTVDQYHQTTPSSLWAKNATTTSINAHANAIGFSVFGQVVLRTIEGMEGWPFIPAYRYFARIAGLNQFLNNIEVIGDMTGWTPVCLTSGYSVAIVGGVLKLSTVGAAPTNHRNKVQVRWDHATKASRTDFFWSSVSTRAINAGLPVKTRRDGRASNYFNSDNVLAGNTPAPIWTPAVRGEITLFAILKFEEDSGLNPLTAVSGQPLSDARIHDIFNMTCRGTGNSSLGFRFERSSSGPTYKLEVKDDSSVTSAVATVTHSSSLWTAVSATGARANVARGLHLVALTLNPAAATYKMFISAGDGPTPGVDVLVSGAMAGSGYPNFLNIDTIQIFGQNAVAVGAGSADASNGQIKAGGSGPYSFFQGQCQGLHVINQYMDISDPAVRALVWNPTTKTAVPFASENLAGVFPTMPAISIIGDPAETYMGATEAWDAPIMGMGLNHGSLKGMMAAYFGQVTTI